MYERRSARAAASALAARRALAERGVDPRSVCSERRAEPDEPNLRCSRRRDDLAVLVGDVREVVEPRHRVVERLRSEDDGERIDVARLVERTQMIGEQLLRHDERAVRGGDLLRELALRSA